MKNAPANKGLGHKRFGRYAVLRHDGIAEPHFDFMLELRQGEKLKTWRLADWPLPKGVRVDATPLPDHRNLYLEYEGPLTDGRGIVFHIEGGEYELADSEQAASTFEVSIRTDRFTLGPNWAMRTQRQDGKRPLHLCFHAATGSQFVPFLQRNLLAAHDILNPALRELSVALVGDRRMGMLHEEFMNIAGPTDVLTFPLEEDGRGRVTDGEVVICVPEARRRVIALAGRNRVAGDKSLSEQKLRCELLLYALHGMLHLCGFDDRTDSAYTTMHRREDEILTQLGIGRVFAPGDGGADSSYHKKQPVRRVGSRRKTTGKTRTTAGGS